VWRGIVGGKEVVAANPKVRRRAKRRVLARRPNKPRVTTRTRAPHKTKRKPLAPRRKAGVAANARTRGRVTRTRGRDVRTLGRVAGTLGRDARMRGRAIRVVPTLIHRGPGAASGRPPCAANAGARVPLRNRTRGTTNGRAPRRANRRARARAHWERGVARGGRLSPRRKPLLRAPTRMRPPLPPPHPLLPPHSPVPSRPPPRTLRFLRPPPPRPPPLRPPRRGLSVHRERALPAALAETRGAVAAAVAEATAMRSGVVQLALLGVRPPRRAWPLRPRSAICLLARSRSRMSGERRTARRGVALPRHL
jgi:hypothetical protein